jgi:steroid delta-isomerase-like uncharacterized protein
MSAATDIVSRIEQAFADGDVDAFARCFAEDAVQVHPMFPEAHKGRQAIRDAEATMFAGFDQIRLVATSMVEAEDRAAVEWQVRARHCAPIRMPDGAELPPSGAVVDLPMASFLRLDPSGLVAEEHRYQDGLTFLRQLGVLG